MAPPPAQAWHALSPDGCLAQLHSSPDGLSSEGAAQRLARDGPNRLELRSGRSSLQILWMNLVTEELPALVFELTTVLQLLLLVYVPALSAFFGTQPLNLVV